MPRQHMLAVGIQKLAVKRGQDDREFGLRCLKAGVEGVFDPTLHALHLYDRSLDAYRRDCRVQGESRQLIHHAHGDLLGPDLVHVARGSEAVDGVGTNVPAPLRPLWRALAADPAFPLVTALGARVHAAALRQGHLGLEVFAARAIGSLEVMRGVLDSEAQPSSERAVAASSAGVAVAGAASRRTGTSAATAAQTSRNAASSGGSST